MFIYVRTLGVGMGRDLEVGGHGLIDVKFWYLSGGEGQ
jgi:hypothetical protein